MQYKYWITPVYFISGHLDLTEQEFKEHYIPLIDKALIPTIIDNIAYPSRFIVGDARGCDLMTQNYLNNRSNNVTIYHMFDSPRNNPHKYPTVSGFTTDLSRDIAMTDNSDIDIAWVRPGKGACGTFKNIQRRG